MQRKVIRNARVLPADGVGSGLHDIVVVGERVQSVRPAGTEVPSGDLVIDARGGVALPGLCNAHAHTNEFALKGTVSDLPLEPYFVELLLRGTSDPRPEDVYACTLASCAEMIGGGVTSVADDVIHADLRPDLVDAVLQAYVDSGMRANVSIMLLDKPLDQEVAFLADLVPDGARKLLSTAVHGRPREDVVRFCADRMTEWQSQSRVAVMTSPSAPQRATPELMRDLFELSHRFDVPCHIHIQETLAQAVSGPVMFGSSMLAYVDDLGLLDEFSTIAHGVWLSDEDIQRVANRGATVIHNPTSNMKLGSGVARVRAMQEAGVNVALGCDGYTCNDTADMFEAMKNAALLSRIATPHVERWLSPTEVLAMATVNGTQANRFREVGALAPGMRADITVLDPDAWAYVPLNDAASQTVFNAKSADVRTVLVDGRLLLHQGAFVGLDVVRVRDDARAATERVLGTATRWTQESTALRDAMEQAYLKCVERLDSVPVQRLLDS